MTRRRFIKKPEIDPAAVSSLAVTHPAIMENRTLYPSTVVEVTEDDPDRLLVSGETNRKLGKIVAKGPFKGYALYALSLEERATCPVECDARLFCFGNAMPFARRHKIGDPEVFYDRLNFEILGLLAEHPGLLIRLHVVGDFPSVEYVSFWADVLAENPKVAIYGYTHRRTKAWDGDEIGDAIQSVKDRFPERFRIRWSSEVSRPDGTVIVDYEPKRPRIDEGLVCPAQTDATACCASCGLCWDKGATHDTIVFIKHGRKSLETAAETATIEPLSLEARRIEPIQMPSGSKPAAIASFAPQMRMVKPGELLVEPRYQRDLSGKSIKLIRKIVSSWDWAKFKPPIVADTKDGLFVIDGQHTAIAAASHSGVTQIPVMIASADLLVKRAEAFVSHNRDRIAMTPHQIFHAELAAGSAVASAMAALAKKTGAIIPRSAPLRGKAKPGQVLAVQECTRIYNAHGAAVLERVFRIAVAAELAPLGNTVARGLRILLTEKAAFGDLRVPDSAIANALKANPDIETQSRTVAIESECGRDWCCASILYEECQESSRKAA